MASLSCRIRLYPPHLRLMLILLVNSVQVNIPAESGEMGILANHVPSIEQLKPGLVEIIEESGGSKQFFCSYHVDEVVLL
jgi:ATP synthase, Delta/Epsilon chain, beta-sandwich domain